MLFDAAALTFFWEDPTAMCLENRMRTQLVLKGIEFPADLAEFNDKGLEKIFKNLAYPAKVPTGVGAAAHLCEVPAFTMSGTKMAKFYETIGRSLSANNMKWPVIKNFLEQHTALEERKSKSSVDSTLPKITKMIAVHHWLESLNIYLARKVGACHAALPYVVRETAAVSAAVPLCAPGEPHSEEYGSIEGDQAHRLSHTHRLFKVDNAEVFDLIETAVRGSEALQAIKNQHAGV